MKHRIVLRVGYNEAYFEFNDIERAGDFAREILLHSVGSDDTSKKTSVRIETILDEEIAEDNDVNGEDNNEGGDADEE